MKLGPVVPTLRIFDAAKAREFYLDYMAFTVDFEHRFGDGFPLFMQVSREGCVLRLSEHHGDGSPGIAVTVLTDHIDELLEDLAARPRNYLHPAIQHTEWGTRELRVTDPFGNRITFEEPAAGHGGRVKQDPL